MSMSSSNVEFTDSEEERELEIVSKSIKEQAKNVTFMLLPKTSKQLYVKTYNKFKQWMRENGTNSFRQDVMLAYFGYLSKIYKAPSSLWPIYSMLKSTLIALANVNINKYSKLIGFIKNLNVGYEPVKAPVFIEQDVSRYLSEAPNETHLSAKVIFIFGVLGAMRRGEFAKLLKKDVVDVDGTLFVKVNLTKTKKNRSFTISHHGLYDICQEYINARPVPCQSDRFFLKYKGKKCTQQPIGINTFGTVPRKIALYLELPDALLYTGHSLRRTSATILVNAGANIFTLMRHGGWSSVKSAQGYVAESMSNKRKICDQITSNIVLSKKPSILNEPSETNSAHRVVSIPEQSNPTVNLQSSTSSIEINDSSVQASCAKQNVTPVAESALTSAATVQPNVDLTPKKTYPVFYDPDLGLYGLELTDDNTSLVFYNCDVKLEKGLHKSIILNNCTINIS